MVFIVELAVGIAACLFKADLDELLQKSLQKSIERSSQDDLTAWDNVQRKLGCCGITDSEDWVTFKKGGTIRPSCCRQNDINFVNDCTKTPGLYSDKFHEVQLRYKYFLEKAI